MYLNALTPVHRMSVWAYALVSTLFVSLISLVGVVTLGLTQKKLENILLLLVSFSAGALLGDAFIHLIPEALETSSSLVVAGGVLGGILIFFVLEKFIHWRHCHVPTSHKHPHPFAITNLVGDLLHNFIDGIVIGASYLISIPVGIATTIAVILHEIPQEIGDFGVLIHGGFSRSKALLLNFFSGLTALVGTILVLVIHTSVNIAHILLPLTAGGFIYIAGSDLIPELHKEVKITHSIKQFVFLVIGILLMLLLLLIE